MKKVIKILLIIVGVIAVLIVANEVTSCSNRNGFVDSLEKGDFVKARKLAESYADKKKVTNAQVNDLISKGQFDLAVEIAKEDNYYLTYFNGVIDHLPKIYTDQGRDKLLYAMSLINYPDTKSRDMDESWGERWDIRFEPRDIIIRSNTNIESFCDYLRLTGREDLIPQMLQFLKPVWEFAETKWDYKRQEDVLIQKAHMNDSEVKRIKKKFGY